MTWIVLGIIIAAIVFLISVYNGLITSRNAYKNAFAQIDVQLQRRHDLIPNLVETVEAVIAARNSAVTSLKNAAASPGDPAAMKQLADTQAVLTGAMGRLMAVAEAYPDLKANQNMMQLSEELASTENRVAFARQAFNDSVMSYNNKREVFPSNLVSGMFGFGPAQMLELENP